MQTDVLYNNHRETKVFAAPSSDVYVATILYIGFIFVKGKKNQ